MLHIHRFYLQMMQNCLNMGVDELYKWTTEWLLNLNQNVRLSHLAGCIISVRF